MCAFEVRTSKSKKMFVDLLVCSMPYVTSVFRETRSTSARVYSHSTSSLQASCLDACFWHFACASKRSGCGTSKSVACVALSSGSLLA